ncbi:MAG: hypothetical protein VW239_10585 [Candidatus Nanopelagicales bacterium]
MVAGMTQSAYALIALRQAIPLDQIATGAGDRHFPILRSSTPDWFAAAAGHASSLDDIAPELRVNPEQADADLDLIRMYAPELRESNEQMAQPIEDVDDQPARPRYVPPDATQTNVRLDLLAELRDIDE